jgi:hypothetical protein
VLVRLVEEVVEAGHGLAHRVLLGLQLPPDHKDSLVELLLARRLKRIQARLVRTQGHDVLH